ncbi:hypothetical protein F5141DRAFT_1220913 [Pisolithus sp. B1]|nr:hypothetical protein F5141DRAFT_1220913 [Pisolithus sp. B1]
MLSRTLLAWYRGSTAAKCEVDDALRTLKDWKEESEESESSDVPTDPAIVSRTASFLTDGSGSTNIASSAGSAASTGAVDPIITCIAGKGERRNRNGNNIQSATLFALCNELQIHIDHKPGKLPSKSMLLAALGQWHTENIGSNRHHTKPLPGLMYSAQSKSRGHSCKSVVLGDQILPEVWEDQQKLILPSFVSPTPANFGLASRSLSADQWCSVGTIHLVITLIWLWGFDMGQKGEMLVNYIHLVTAIHWANMHTTSKFAADEYMFHMLEYLRGLVQLYKEAKVQPTHHLALHIGDLLLVFGPVHSWRTWAFERYNYMLQNIKSNNKFGELELTFMNDACRAANLTAYMFGGRVQAFANLLPAFLQAFYSDIRGTRLNDILSFSLSSKTCLYMWHPSAKGQQAAQDKGHVSLAMHHIQTQSSSDVVFCTKVRREGMCYQANLCSPGDANIIMRASGDSSCNDGCEPAHILALFCDRRKLEHNSNDRHPFAVIECHVPLKANHQPHDPYRRFGFAAVGGLYYDKFHPPKVVAIDDIIMQFAKMHFDRFDDRLPVEVVHVLPILRNIHFDDVDTELSDNNHGEEEGKILEDVLL